MSVKQITRILFLFIWASSAFADPYDIKTCKKWAPEDWDIFIEDKLLGRDGSHLKTGPIFAINPLKKAEEYCPKQFNSPEITKCLQRLDEYSKIFIQSKSDSLFSFIKSDKDYLDSQPKSRMELPNEIKNAPRGLPKNWKELAEKNNWQWILYDSQVGYPKSESRLILTIPHEEYTQLLMYYGSHGNQDPTTFIGLQMITVERAQDKKILEQSKVHFRAFSFKEEDELPRLRLGGDEKCVRCHISGPRAIVLPNKGTFPTQMSKNTSLAAINELIIKGSKAPDYSEIYNVDKFPTHLPVGEKYECTQCHDGKTRNSLSFIVGNGTGMFDLDNLIHHKVKKEKTMPKDPSWEVTEDERNKMGDEIFDDYHVQLKKWLTEIKCDDSKGGSAQKAKHVLEPAKGIK